MTPPPALSARLRADVALRSGPDGHLLTVGDSDHHVHLDEPEISALHDALVDGGRPALPRARAALDSMVAAGLVDAAPPRIAVGGPGVLATALRAALERMGAVLADDGTPVLALDDDIPAVDRPDGGPTATCWTVGHRVVLSPPAVPAAQVAARHRAATLHRDADPRVEALPSGRAVRSATPVLGGAGLELAATLVAAELLRTDRAAYEVLAVDLVGLVASRHLVLPVPPAPR